MKWIWAERNKMKSVFNSYACLLLVAFLGLGVRKMALAIDAPSVPDKILASDLANGPIAVKPSDYRIGERIENLAFSDLQGQKRHLFENDRTRATVIIMHKVGCPLSGKYAATLRHIVERYQRFGVDFLVVNGGRDSAEKLKQTLSEFAIQARAIPDPHHELANALHAKSSTDSFVIDSAHTLVYRGPIDDQYGFTYSRSAPVRNLLVEAIDATLMGDPIDSPAWMGPGCPLQLNLTWNRGAKVTYHNQIARIIQNNCQKCHRPGAGAPFSLMSYEETRDQIPMIEQVIKRGIMPPWFASPKVGHFVNDARLTEKDKRAFLEWIHSGAPEGNASEAPLSKKWSNGWHIGTPDHIVTVPRPNDVPAGGTVPYHYVFLDTGLTEDKWIQKIEIRPSSPAVVHHILAFISYPQNHPKFVAVPHPGLHGFFAGYVPGQSYQIIPKGLALKLPREAKLVLQIHYQPNGRATRDQPSVGMVFSKSNPEAELEVGGVTNISFVIPPGEDNFSVTGYHRFETPAKILALTPHMHLRGKAFRYEVIFPDGRRETLLEIPKYDFNWQLEYRLQTPIEVPAGAALSATGWFDNSARNPANPDPRQAVRFGEQTWDEMMIGYFQWQRK